MPVRSSVTASAETRVTLALNDGSRSLLISHETNCGRQIRSYYIDIDWLNLDLEHEFVADRNKVKNRTSGRDHSPWGVNAEIHHHAILGRGNRVALGLGSRLALLLTQ